MIRVAGAALLACACAAAALPAFDWYSAETPAGRVGASGFGVSGVLWLVPVVAAAMAVAGAALLAAGPDRRVRVARWAGPAAFAAALLVIAATLWVGVDGDVRLVAAGEEVAGPIAVAVDREPAGLLCAVAGMVAGAIAWAVSALAWRA